MSNYFGMARPKGSTEEFKDVVFIDNYFGPRKYGVRIRGQVAVKPIEEYEYFDDGSIDLCDSCYCMTHTIMPYRTCGKCGEVKSPEERVAGDLFPVGVASVFAALNGIGVEEECNRILRQEEEMKQKCKGSKK